MSSANVKSIDIIKNTSKRLEVNLSELKSTSSSFLNLCSQLLEEANLELVESNKLLTAAIAEEKFRYAEVCAWAVGLPDTYPEYAQAKYEHNIALERVRRFEKRVELANKSVEIASNNLEDKNDLVSYILKSSEELTNTTINRMVNANSDLEKYLDNLDDISRNKVVEYMNYKKDLKTPLFPDEINRRLDLSEAEIKSILIEKYGKDEKFKAMIDEYRKVISENPNHNIDDRIKKNLSGMLGEEIVIKSLSPYCENISTQDRTYFDDGRYTKTDLILKNLKVPVILGRGDGMGGIVGGELAIEVKTGRPEYIFSQMEHMMFQAQGHQKSDISCTICSKDIKDLGENKEKILRSSLRESGSPLLGMLPKKEVLDSICKDFVYGG